MTNIFQPATRRKAKARIALTGVSGSGKTLSALYIAEGLAGDWRRVAIIDTEHERARFYAQRSDLGTGAFLWASLTPPYSPDRYIQLVNEAYRAVGDDGVVIVDSLSHAWSNEGGVLDIKDRIAARPGMNNYTAWADAGRLQNELINAILAVPCHTICTLRSKMAYALQEDDRGRQRPVKLGLAPVQRDDTEYEFDIVLDIDRDHIARASKDTTFLDRYGEIITPELGRRLAAWLDEGAEPPVCSYCHKIITPAAGLSADEIVARSTAKYGAPYCVSCGRIIAKQLAGETVPDSEIPPEALADG